MSHSIWTRSAAGSNLRPLSGRPWRVVESEHVVATRRLVDSLEEQALLERLLDEHQPPGSPTLRGLHPLLVAPFRSPPLRHGSRFGSRNERGLWYGADELRTALAEVAYYRLLFCDGTRGRFGPLTLTLSAFSVPVATDEGVDLTSPPFVDQRAAISSPSRYDASQALGRELRAAGAVALRYFSARRPEGTGVALFAPAFSAAPDPAEGWFARVEARGVEYTPAHLPHRSPVVFPRTAFEVDGVLPAPAM